MVTKSKSPVANATREASGLFRGRVLSYRGVVLSASAKAYKRIGDAIAWARKAIAPDAAAERITPAARARRVLVWAVSLLTTLADKLSLPHPAACLHRLGSLSVSRRRGRVV